MAAFDLGRLEMNKVIDTLNNNFGAKATVINEGQLDFALEKPRMSLRGTELYPDLHQKAAVLMETLCKSHTLSDGNKRASVMAAEYLAGINGATLVVPLKTARLAVDCAMDAGDEMFEEIAAWFKAHMARDELELAVMLEEVVEERDMVAALLGQRRYDEAEQLVDGWLAFDSSPENKIAWSRLVEKWKDKEEAQRLGSMATKPYFFPWFSLGDGLRIDDRTPRYPALRDARIANPVYIGHGLEDLERADAHVRESVERLRDPSCDADELWNAGLMLENFRHFWPASRVYESAPEGRRASARPVSPAGQPGLQRTVREGAWCARQACRARLGAARQPIGLERAGKPLDMQGAVPVRSAYSAGHKFLTPFKVQAPHPRLDFARNGSKTCVLDYSAADNS